VINHFDLEVKIKTTYSQLPVLILSIFFTASAFAIPWQEATGTGYEVKLPPNYVIGTSYGKGISNVLMNAPMGGYHSSYTNIVIIYFFEAEDAVCKIRPADKAGSAQPLAVYIKGGMPKAVMIDGGKENESELLYVYVEGNLKKLKIKGFGTVGKIAISNNNEGTGVTIQNASKAAAGQIAGNIHSVIVSGKLKKLQSNKGGFGGFSPTDTGVIAIEGASPGGMIKVGKGGEMSNLLFCGGLVNGGYNYAEAFNECWSSQQVLQTVIKIGLVKKVKTKAIGPGVFGLQVEKKYKDATKLKITDLVGMENLVE